MMLGSIHSVVVGVPDLDPGDPVLRYGLDLSERIGATLHLVHAFAVPDVLPELETTDADSAAPPVRFPAAKQGTDLEKPLKERLYSAVPASLIGSRVVPHFVPGAPSRAIQETAEEVGAKLIVVGATRRGQMESVLLGTTAARTVRGATVPVFVLREPPRFAGTRVLLTTDLSDLSRSACDAGLEIVHSLFGGDAIQVRCLLAVFPGSAELPADGAARFRLDAEPLLHRFVDSLNASRTNITGVVRTGAPADEILAEAAEWPADLVVVGTHGRSGLSRLLLGSVAEAAIRDLDCSTLVIPARSFGADTNS